MLFILKMKSIFYPIPSNLPPLFPKSFPSLSSSFSSSSSLLFKTPKTLISPKSACILPPKRPFCSPIFSSMETTRSSCGEVHVIVGPMFAGKTTALLRRVQSERDNGRNVAIIKSDKDTRYGLDFVVTHDGVKLPCWALPDLTSIRQKLGKDAYEKIDVIGIDEAQFFDDLHDFCSKAADYDGKTVIVAGLDGDYLRRRFGSVLDVIPLADSVTKLTARCELCGKRAFFTLRKTTDTKTELIGGADVYMPVCRQHYVNGQVVIEAARTVLESKNIQCDSCIEATP